MRSGDGEARTLDRTNLPALALGCGILGAGGGGNPEIGLLIAQQGVETHGPVPLADLQELPPDGLLLPCGGIGAPTVSIEKIQNGGEGQRLREAVEDLWGRPVVALMCGEIGGSNGIMPVGWAARMGLPVVDADGMGRAFPEVYQVSMELADVSPSPAVMTDERGNVLVFRSVSGRWLERMERRASIEFGGRGYSAEYVMSIEQAQRATIRGSVSLALRIGRAILEANDDPVRRLLEEVGGFRLLTGTVVDVDRRTESGFARGSVTIEGTGVDARRAVRIEFQNENLVAAVDGIVRASVPDLICVLDAASASAVTTERLRYGQRVTAVALSANPVWRSRAGLAVAGPSAFGYPFDYVAVEELHAEAS